MSWLTSAVLPMPGGLAGDLVESLDHPMMASDNGLRDLVSDPAGGLVGVDDSIKRALTSRLRAPVDYPTHPEGGFPKGFSNLGAVLSKEGDILITKRQWGAFTGTELDLQLRRRGIRTIVLGGVATNMGVESTARQACELNYEVVIAKEATTSLAADLHEFAMTRIFPMIARVTDGVSFS